MSRILVAEDDPHILRVISLWLTRQGHEVLEARNGVAALEVLRAAVEAGPAPAGGGAIEVLITDVNMPQMDGLALIEYCVELPAPPGGIVVLTNRWDHGAIRDRLAKWGVHVLPKPFSPIGLAELVGRLTSAAGAAGRAMESEA